MKKAFHRVWSMVLSLSLVLGLFAGIPFPKVSAAASTHNLATLLNEGKIKALGRTQVNTTGDGITANWSANGFEMNVKSNGGDFAIGYKTNANNGYVAVLVDGVQVWRGAIHGTGTIKVPLTAGKHTVSAIREHGHASSTTSYIHFTTVNFDGTVEARPADKSLFIEVVGDSYACGAGSAAEYEPGVKWGDADHTSQGAFGWYLAKMLGADLSIVARGGIGLFDGTSEQEGTPNTVTMRDIYPYASGHNKTDGLYDFARKPDLVVIELGANDGINNSDPTKTISNWAAKLREMISLVRAKNGTDTKILLLSHNAAKYEQMLRIADADENIWACHFSHHGNGSAALDTQYEGHPSADDEYEIAEALFKSIQDNRILAPAETEPTYNDIVYYVSESGNDANDGKTIGTAKKTVKSAWNKAVADNKTFANGSRLVFRIQGTVQYSTTGDQGFMPGTKKTADGKNLPILVTTYNYNGTKAILDSGIAAINDGHGDMVIHNSVTFKDITFQSTTRSDGQFRHRNLHTGYGDVVFDNVTFAHAGAAPAKNNTGWRIGCGTGFGSDPHPTTLTHSSVTFKNGDYTNLDFASAVLSNSMWKADGTIYSLPTAEFHVIIEEGARMGTVYGAWGTLAVAGATVELNGGTVEKLYPTWSAPSDSPVTYNTNIETIFNGGKLNDPRFMGTGAYNTINGDVTVEFKRGQYIGTLFTGVGNNTTVNGNVTNNISGGEIRLNPTSTTTGADGIYLGGLYGLTINGNLVNNISGGDLNLIYNANVDCGIYLGIRGGSLNGNQTNNISGGNLMAVNGTATAKSSGIYLGAYSGNISGTLTNNVTGGTFDGGVNFGDRTIGNKIGKIVNILGVEGSLQGPRIFSGVNLGGGWAYLGSYVGNRQLTDADCSDTVVLDTTIYGGFYSGAVYAGVGGANYSTTYSYVSGSVKTNIYGGKFPGGFYCAGNAFTAGHVTTNIYGGIFSSIYGSNKGDVFDGVELNIYGMKEYYGVNPTAGFGIWASGNASNISAKTAGRDAVKLTIAPKNNEGLILRTPIYAGFYGTGTVTGNTTVSVSGGIYPKGFQVNGKTVGEVLASGYTAYGYPNGQKLTYSASDASISGHVEIRSGAPAATRTVSYYVRPNGSNDNDGTTFLSAEQTLYGAFCQAVADNGGSRVFPNGTKLVIYVDGTVTTGAGQSMGYYNLLTTADGKHLETVVTTYNYGATNTKATLVQSHTPTDSGSSSVYLGTDMTFKDIDIVSRVTDKGFVTQFLYAAGCNLTFDNANLYTNNGVKWMVAADHFSTGGQNPASGNRMDATITFRNGDYTNLSYVTTNNVGSVWISSGNTLKEAPNMHCKVVIEDGAKMGSVYGPVGGMKIGSAIVEVRGGEVANLYGTGSGTKNIGIDTTLIVSGGKVNTLHGTGNGAAVKITGDINITVSGGTVGKFNGTGTEVTVTGDINTTISGGTVTNFDGAGEKAVITGNITNTFSGGTVDGRKFNGLYNNVVLNGNLTNNFTGTVLELNPTDTGNGVDAIFLSGRGTITINGNVTNNISAGSLGILYKVTGIKSGIYFGLRSGWINGNLTNNITGGEFYCRAENSDIVPGYSGIHMTGFSGASVRDTVTNNITAGTFFSVNGSYYMGQQGIDGSTGKVVNVIGDQATGTGPSFLNEKNLMLAGGWGRIGVNDNSGALPADGVVNTVVVDSTIYGGTFTGITNASLNASTGTYVTYIKGGVQTVIHGGTFNTFYGNGLSPTYGHVKTEIHGGSFNRIYGAYSGKVHGNVTLNIYGMTEGEAPVGIWAAGTTAPIVGNVRLTIEPKAALTLSMPISIGHDGTGTVSGTKTALVTGGTYENGFAINGLKVKDVLASGLVPLKQDNTVVRVTDTMTTTGTDSVTLVSAAWTADNATVTLSDTEVSYDGVNNAKIPTETVKFHNTTLVKDTDYTVSYQRNGAATTDLNSLGEVTVVITAKAPYSGTLKATYTVVRSSAVKTLIDQLTERTNAFKADTVTADDTAALNQLKSDINKALSDYAQVLTDSEKQTLNGLLTQVAALEKVISTVATDLNTLGAVISDYDIATITADEAMQLSMLETALGRIKDSNLTASQKARKQELQAQLAALKAQIDQVANALAKATTECAKYSSDTVTADNTAALTKLASDIAAIPDGNLTAAQKAEKKTLADKVAALQKVISDTAAELAAVKTAVAAYDEDTVTADDKADLEALAARIAAIPDGNLTAAQKTEKKAAADKVAALLALVADASDVLAQIKTELNAYDLATVTADDLTALNGLAARLEALADNRLTAVQKAEKAALVVKVTALQDRIADTAADLAAVVAQANGYKTETVTADDAAALTALAADIAAIPDGNLTAAQKSEKKAAADKVAALQKVISDTAAALTAVVNEAAEFEASTVTADDAAALTALETAAEAIADGNLTKAQKERKQEVLAHVAHMKSIIEAVADDLADAKTQADSYKTETVTADDAAALTALAADIAAIPDGNLTAAQKSEKKALADKVAALQKVISDTAKALADAKAALEALDETTITSADAAALAALKEQLAAIPDGNLTAAQKSEKKAMADAIAAMEKTLADTAADLAAFRAAVEAYDPAKLTAADKTGLEALLKQLQEYPTDHLTDAEKKTLSDLAKTVEGLIEAIEKAEEIAGDIAAIEKLLEGKTEDTVTSDDEAELIAAGNAIEDLLRNGDLTEADRTKLAQLLKQVEDLLAHLEEAEKAAEVSEEVKDITPETVEPEDQETLEEAIEALEEALETYGDNYTEAEKKAIEAAIAALEESLAVIEAVEAVEKQIESLPETAEPDDEKAIEALKAAVAAYNALTDRQKAMISEDALDRMDTLAASLLNYKVTQGAEGEWNKGSEKSATLTVNGLLSKFVSVELDGKVVDPKHYSAVSGSTIITFHSTFLEDLSEGKHTVTVNFTDGKVEATLTIKAKPVNPETGDNAAPALLLLVALASFATAAALVIDRKRRAR